MAEKLHSLDRMKLEAYKRTLIRERTDNDKRIIRDGHDKDSEHVIEQEKGARIITDTDDYL
jgi:hypothetical protein